MNQKNPSQAIDLTFAKAPVKSLDAGMPLSFAVKAAFPDGVKAEGATYRVLDGKKPVAEGDIPTAGEDGAIPFSLAAPEAAGEHRWSLHIATAPNLKGERAEGFLAFDFATLAHATSLAVWDTPSPAIRGSSFTIKVGAKCTSSCTHSGETIEVRDETGKLMGSAPLGDATIAETSGLHGTSVTLKAPRKLKLHEWTVNFSPDTKLPHTGSSARFTFMVVPEPAFNLSVKVIDKKTKAPVAGAQVRLGVYRATTSEKGSAKLAVAKGEFPLVVTRTGYEIPERTLKIAEDMRIQIGAEKLPEEDPFAAWTA